MHFEQIYIKMALLDVSLPTNGIKIQTNNTKAFIASNEIGSGLLCVAER